MQLTKKTIWKIVLILAFLLPLSCNTFGSLDVQVETTPVGATASPFPATATLVTNGTFKDESGQLIAVAPPVAGWLGYVETLPEGSPFDDALVLSPEGTGSLGVAGATTELENEIVGLRDKEEPGKFAHFWGKLNCEIEDYNGCQLLVTKLRYGATATEGDQVAAWQGKLMSHTFNSGLSSVLVLDYRFPMWFSVDSNDMDIKSQIESLRDSGAVVRLWGELLTGIPDVNGSRIQVNRIEVITEGSVVAPPAEATIDPTEGWLTYTNERYGYQFKYPETATISEQGPLGFPTDDLPDGMDTEQYMIALQEQYGNTLCVSIKYSLGFIGISAPPNSGYKYAPCGPTGLGAGEVMSRAETILFLGQPIAVNGFEFNAAGGGNTLDAQTEIFNFILEDGTQFTYGALPRTDATYEDYLTKTKDTLLEILETYEITN
ncbi:MAG: hypothetical protein JXB38_17155 [Anaerolineales bacterium]|nr:hypothetical protein [Anaerolineales bacterium]